MAEKPKHKHGTTSNEIEKLRSFLQMVDAPDDIFECVSIIEMTVDFLMRQDIPPFRPTNWEQKWQEREREFATMLLRREREWQRGYAAYNALRDKELDTIRKAVSMDNHTLQDLLASIEVNNPQENVCP